MATQRHLPPLLALRLWCFRQLPQQAQRRAQQRQLDPRASRCHRWQLQSSASGASGAFGSGLICSRCSWLDNCPGCIIEPVGDRPLGIVSPDEGQTIVADWDPALLEEALDRVALVAKDVHPSVAACGEADAKATTLGQCMDAFSREELLDEPGYCGRCSKVRTRGVRPILDPATGTVIGEREVEEEDVIMRRKSKRIELWRVPPVLLVQLKRFHNTATARRKLHNQVAFPLNGLSLSPYMARARTPHPPPDLSAWQWLGGKLAADAGSGGAGAARAPSASVSAAAAAASSGAGSRASTALGAGRDRTSSTGPREAVVSGLPCLLSRSKTTYDLYGVVCHEGILGAGHYTAFARSPHDDHWHEYNDRLVSDVGASLEEAEREIVTPAAYLLFYCRRDVGAGWRAALKAEDAALGRHTTEDPTSPPLQEIERALAAAAAKARADAAAARSRGAAVGGAGAGAGGARGGAGAVARAALRAARAADQQLQQQDTAGDEQSDSHDEDGEQDEQLGGGAGSASAAAAQDHRAAARLRPLETWDLFPHAAGAAPSPELAAVRASMLTAGATVAEAAGFFDSLADKCVIM